MQHKKNTKFGIRVHAMHVWENGLETITLSRKAWLVYSHVNEAEKIKASLFLFHMRGYAFLLSCRRILCSSRITFNGIIVIIRDHLHAFITLTKCLRVLRQFFIFCMNSKLFCYFYLLNCHVSTLLGNYKAKEHSKYYTVVEHISKYSKYLSNCLDEFFEN